MKGGVSGRRVCKPSSDSSGSRQSSAGEPVQSRQSNRVGVGGAKRRSEVRHDEEAGEMIRRSACERSRDDCAWLCSVLDCLCAAMAAADLGLRLQWNGEWSGEWASAGLRIRLVYFPAQQRARKSDESVASRRRRLRRAAASRLAGSGPRRRRSGCVSEWTAPLRSRRWTPSAQTARQPSPPITPVAIRA